MYLELRIAICACMLAIAAVIDIKSREIPDKVWLIFGGLGAALAALELISVPAGEKAAFAIHYSIGIALISSLGYASYRTGLFGGADPKALVAIAVILPSYYTAGFRLYDFPAISVLFNALLVSMTTLLYNIFRNSMSVARRVPIFQGINEGRMRKALAFATGFSSDSPGRHMFAMEETDDDGRRRFRFNPASYEEFAAQDQKRTWVTHALPYIVYIAIGFAINLTVGDLFTLFLKLLAP